jgi:hypothetical protein
MRDTPEGIIEELRESAHLDAFDLELEKEELNAWEAADYIEYLTAALVRIRAGEADPVMIATEALDVRLWIFSESNDDQRISGTSGSG